MTRLDERLPLRPLVRLGHVDSRAKHGVEALVGAWRVDRRAAENEVDVKAGLRPGRGRQAAVVRPSPARRHEGVGAFGQGRPDEELQVPELVPAER